MTADDELIERMARAMHREWNSGVDADVSPLSWDTESEALREWHRQGARAACRAYEDQSDE